MLGSIPGETGRRDVHLSLFRGHHGQLAQRQIRRGLLPGQRGNADLFLCQQSMGRLARNRSWRPIRQRIGQGVSHGTQSVLPMIDALTGHLEPLTGPEEAHARRFRVSESG
jgi:hypothetical protein